MSISKSKKLTGPLSKPIYWDRPEPGILDVGPNGLNEDFHQKQKAAVDELIAMKSAKLKLLLEHYGLAHMPADEWPLQLVLRLTDEFVPGFKVLPKQAKGGRPSIWKDGGYLQLLIDVELIKREKSCDNRAALRALKTRSKTKVKYSPYTPRVLETRLSEARNPKHFPLASLLFGGEPQRQKMLMDALMKVMLENTQHASITETGPDGIRGENSLTKT